MGLMNKLKNILFEEEEVDIPVIEKKEKKETKKKVEQPVYSSYLEEEVLDFVPKKEEPKIVEKKVEPVKQPEPVKQVESFQFLDFDEEEFKNAIPKRTTNVLEKERPKDTRKEYRYEPRVEPKKEEKPKFKPSPIISPVYGILDKNYTPDEITSRKNITPVKNLDVDSVRKKAFGINEEPKDEEKVISDIVLEDKVQEETVLKEKIEKARTIDELLKDSSDEVINVNKDTEVENELEDLIEPMADTGEIEDLNKLDEIEEPLVEEKLDEDKDDLESDLFDLIDSMYENREDGE